MYIVGEPVLTEKTFSKLTQRVYVFLVSRRASKPAIRKEIEYIFNVRVAKINTLHEPRRSKRIGRNRGYLPQHKRAIVTLRDGYSISIYPDNTTQTTSETTPISPPTPTEITIDDATRDSAATPAATQEVMTDE